MREQTDPTLGILSWDDRLKCWNAMVDFPAPIGTVDASIYDSLEINVDMEPLRAFVSWLRDNTESFIQQIAYQSLNMDLIWDDLSEDFIAERIKITHINMLDGIVGVVADPRSFLDDEHLFHIKLDSAHNIVDMHK